MNLRRGLERYRGYYRGLCERECAARGVRLDPTSALAGIEAEIEQSFDDTSASLRSLDDAELRALEGTLSMHDDEAFVHQIYMRAEEYLAQAGLVGQLRVHLLELNGQSASAGDQGGGAGARSTR